MYAAVGIVILIVMVFGGFALTGGHWRRCFTPCRTKC